MSTSDDPGSLHPVSLTDDKHSLYDIDGHPAMPSMSLSDAGSVLNLPMASMNYTGEPDSYGPLFRLVSHCIYDF